MSVKLTYYSEFFIEVIHKKVEKNKYFRVLFVIFTNFSEKEKSGGKDEKKVLLL